MRESQLEQKLVTHIKNLGGIAYKFTSPNRRAVPDRLCIMPCGRVFFVEVKAPTKQPTPLQQHEHKILRELGHIVVIVDNEESIHALT